MIHLDRLHGAGSLVVNADLIETIEAHPDTTITMVTRRKFVVANTVTEVIDKVIAYRQKVNTGAGSGGQGARAVSESGQH